MVFVKGEDGSMKKYACVTCIKGHRSTACQHAGRELVEVRKKGRPVSQCAECRNLRKTKQVHIKCMCPKKSKGSGTKGRASPEKSPDVKMGTGMPPSTSSEAGSIATATASTATSPSSSPSRRLSVIESIDSDRLDLDLEGLLVKPCTRCDRPASYCICTYESRTTSNGDDYMSSASSDGSMTPPHDTPPLRLVIPAARSISSTISLPVTANGTPHSSNPSSPATALRPTLIPIHDPTDDLDSDTPVYKSEQQDIDQQAVLGELNNTTSEELMDQLYNGFSNAKPNIPLDFADNDDDMHDNDYHASPAASSSSATPKSILTPL